MPNTNDNTNVGERRRRYIDHAKDPIYSLKLFKATEAGEDNIQRHLEAGDHVNFPILLYVLLSQTKEHSAEHRVVSWNSNGRGFKVHQREVFETMVMPRFFQSRKYGTFQRQLKWYQFSRVRDGQDMGSFIHPFFLRGRPDLLCHIERLKNRDPPPAELESQDLQHLPPCHDLSFDNLISLCDPAVAKKLKRDESLQLHRSLRTVANFASSVNQIDMWVPPQTAVVSQAGDASSQATHAAPSKRLELTAQELSQVNHADPSKRIESQTADALSQEAVASQFSHHVLLDEKVDEWFRIFPFDSSVAKAGNLIQESSRGRFFQITPRSLEAKVAKLH